jgi:phospholipid/cholesterol/gamma-HCH transport system substrate-binding protein
MQMKIGIVLAVALVLLFMALLVFPTQGVNPFSSKINLVAYFTDVSGLRASAPVWLSGVEVGRVTSVKFAPNTVPLKIKVNLRVQRWVLRYLRRDSQAMVKGMGLLGDMFIELTPGTDAGIPIENGAVLAGVSPEKTQDELARAVDSANALMQSLKSITNAIANGKGTLGKLIQDEQLYDDMHAAVQGLRETLDTLNSSQGTAGLLLRNPSLYQELLATVKDVRGMVEDLKQAEAKIVSPETRASLDKTVKTVSNVVDRVGAIVEGVERIRFDFNFGLDKFESDLVAGRADVLIWPTEDRYYQAGVLQVSRLYGNEKDKTTFQGELAWRILHSPFFIRGGVIKNEYFVAGLDLRSRDNNFRLLLDAYHLQFNPLQVDLRAGYKILDAIEFSAGAEDVLKRPFFKAGLTIFYRDPELVNVYIRTRF